MVSLLPLLLLLVLLPQALLLLRPLPEPLLVKPFVGLPLQPLLLLVLHSQRFLPQPQLLLLGEQLDS